MNAFLGKVVGDFGVDPCPESTSGSAVVSKSIGYQYRPRTNQ